MASFLKFDFSQLAQNMIYKWHHMYALYNGMRLVRLISASAKFPAHKVKIFLNYLRSSGSFFVALEILDR